MLLKEGFALHSSLEMKNSGRRQVKTPVGNKTKRGAELEGTPKTPRSFEVSPCKSTCVDSFSQEPEDRRVQVKSRRPLQWTNLTKQGIDAMAAEGSFENTLQSPFLHRDLKSNGESEAVAALSPICVNALQGNTDQQGGRINAAIKNPNEMSPPLALITMKGCCDSCSKDQGYGRAPEEAQKNANDDHGQRTPVDSGSCHSSPECQISALTGERIFLWSNAAFCQRPAHEETVSSRKGMATSASCSSSGSSARHKAACITERADYEAESKATDQDSLPKTDGDQRPVVDGRHGIGSSNQETKLPGIRVERTKLSDSSMARELLFEYDKCCLGGLILEPDHGTSPYLVQQRSDTNERTGVRKRVMHAGKAVGNEDARVEIGLEEIEEEIQRLTERLTELHLQKRTREEEMRRRHIEETTSHAGSKEATDQDQRSGVTANPPERRGKQSVGTGAKIGKRVVSVSSSTGSMLQSPGRPCHEVVLKPKLETPGSRQEHCRRTSKASKLSELRRSVSSASRRTECNRRSSDAEGDRSKVLRRLSMSESMTSSPSNVLLHSQQRQPRSFPGKGSSTPSRVVSSRYGRALTPDACRRSGGGSTVACRNRDRPSSAASSPLPQPPAALASSPFKRVATLRSGYPSRSGFVTPTKERQQLVSLSATRTSSPDASAPSSSTSSSRAQKLGRLLYSPSKSSLIARVDSPKSTAALYKCLESLLEDSKHFFKHLSPARSRLHTHLLPQQQQAATTPCNTLQEPTLPNINTCRVNAISPRDSGCVKRECDRQKKRFFFATQDEPQRHDYL